MEIIFNQLWIIFIISNFFNIKLLKRRTKKYIEREPELEEGYNNFFKNYIIFGNIPWVIIGIGNLTGMTTSIFEYLILYKMNPIVIAFYVYLTVILIWMVKWIYFDNGAEIIEKYPGFSRRKRFDGRTSMTFREVKIMFPLILLSWIGVLIFLCIYPMLID